MHIKYKQALLSFNKSGQGSQALLLFHGFGQDQSAFQELCAAVGDKYTCYSFDLFFHGNSEWNYGTNPVSRQFFEELMEQFFIENQIQQFSTLGFSIGSRFALTCAALFPSRTKELFLLAPDNIQPNFWYRLATSTMLGRTLFKFVIFHPKGWLKIVTLAEKLKLADPQLLRFASYQLSTEIKRKKVYFTWMVFRKLTCDAKTLSRTIKNYQINLTVFVGKRDNVIAVNKVNTLQKYIPGFSPIVLDCNHQGLIKSSKAYLQKN